MPRKKNEGIPSGSLFILKDEDVPKRKRKKANRSVVNTRSGIKLGSVLGARTRKK